MNHVVTCTCGEVLVKGLAENLKVRAAKVIVLREGAAYAVCKSCDQEVRIPLQLDQDMLKSMSVVPRQPPLYVNVVVQRKRS